MTRPYYEHNGITIYHGDCREVLGGLPKSDLLLTDPPYGIGYVHGVGGGCLAKSTTFAGVRVIGDDLPFDPTFLLSVAPTQILWGANHYSQLLPPSSCWLVWDKREGMCENDQADCELAWTNIRKPARLKRHYWNGMLKASERGESRVHPTQKPIALMQWCLEQSGTDGLILDPFCGSCSTLVAAKNAGRQAIGIEINERFCELGAQRLSQETLQFESAKDSEVATQENLL